MVLINFLRVKVLWRFLYFAGFLLLRTFFSNTWIFKHNHYHLIFVMVPEYKCFWFDGFAYYCRKMFCSNTPSSKMSWQQQFVQYCTIPRVLLLFHFVHLFILLVKYYSPLTQRDVTVHMLAVGYTHTATHTTCFRLFSVWTQSRCWLQKFMISWWKSTVVLQRITLDLGETGVYIVLSRSNRLAIMTLTSCLLGDLETSHQYGCSS